MGKRSEKGQPPPTATTISRLSPSFSDVLGMLASRHDFAIELHGQAFAGQFELIQQPGNQEGCVEAMRLAVDGNLYHQSAEIQ